MTTSNSSLLFLSGTINLTKQIKVEEFKSDYILLVSDGQVVILLVKNIHGQYIPIQLPFDPNNNSALLTFYDFENNLVVRSNGSMVLSIANIVIDLDSKLVNVDTMGGFSSSFFPIPPQHSSDVHMLGE